MESKKRLQNKTIPASVRARMPVRRTLLPVVDPAAIEAEQLEVQRTFESTNGLGSCRDTVLPTSALPGPDGLVDCILVLLCEHINAFFDGLLHYLGFIVLGLDKC